MNNCSSISLFELSSISFDIMMFIPDWISQHQSRATWALEKTFFDFFLLNIHRAFPVPPESLIIFYFLLFSIIPIKITNIHFLPVTSLIFPFHPAKCQKEVPNYFSFSQVLQFTTFLHLSHSRRWSRG